MNFKLNMKKIIIAIAVLIVIAILLILILFSYNYIISQKNHKLALSLCDDIYSECKANRVVSCSYKKSTIYRVDYGCLDLPARYFDLDLKVISYCGGMPFPGEPEPSQTCFDLASACVKSENICAN